MTSPAARGSQPAGSASEVASSPPKAPSIPQKGIVGSPPNSSTFEATLQGRGRDRAESLPNGKGSPTVTSQRRIRKGERNESIEAQLRPTKNVELPSLSSIDSPFQVQEYLHLTISADPHNVKRIVTVPGSVDHKGKGVDLSNGPEGEANSDASGLVDKNVWLYEQLRRLALDLTHPFVTSLQEVCTRETCPEMKAGEWLYLCAAHAAVNDHDCCAIDYITHTLDGATALLNSSRYFPSRLSIAGTSLKHFTSIARRLYRIFAHAYFHHRDIFEQCESETSLYARFLLLSTTYDLISPDLFVIPINQEAKDEHDRGPPRNSPGRLASVGATASKTVEGEEPD